MQHCVVMAEDQMPHQSGYISDLGERLGLVPKGTKISTHAVTLA